MARCILIIVGSMLLAGCGGAKPAETPLIPDAVPDRNFDEEAENKAIEKVKKLGGRYSRPKPGEAVHEVIFKNVALKDDDLHLLKSFPKLTGLTIQDCPGFTGVGLKHLAYTPQLALLQLAGVNVSEPLVSLRLRFLGLARVRLSVVEVQQLAKMNQLQTIEFVEIPLTESHLKALGELPELMELLVRDTGLSKEAAQAFADGVNEKRPKEKPRLGISF